MQATEIKLEIARIIPHQIHCKTLKEEKGECNCNHDAIVAELDTFIHHLLRGIR